MRLTIARKLWLAFAIVLVLLVAVAALAVYSLDSVRTSVANLIELHGVAEALDRSTEQLLLERTFMVQYIATGDANYAADALAAQSAHWDAWWIVQEWGAERGIEEVPAMEEAVFSYHTLLASSVGSYEEHPSQRTSVLEELGGSQYYIGVLGPVRDELAAVIGAQVDAAEQSVEARLAAMRLVAVGAGALAFVAAVLSAYYISRGISRAAKHLAGAAESISRGDLDVPIEVKTGDEMQDLAEAIERMRASLKAAFERLRRRSGAT
jgi:nitrogen fixation/metabolism regulation signal transduction histidine kinase